MEQEAVRKLRMTRLEIARQIKWACEGSRISFYLSGGSLLGSHQITQLHFGEGETY